MPLEGDRPHLIPDYVAMQCLRHGPGPAPSIRWHGWYWGWCLGCDFTLDEMWEIFSRVNGFGPQRFEHTWAAVERNNGPSFWRSSV